ncbi:hypothetical protein BDK51DRAFT_40357 [Blyttiomyces helicus]|uniref:Uncharacterized protein n=1 Tax=Blyttiomyces helicus TaxID=388810 RepID=A0A4P9W302_9FUNG|nr:hypothetical protein BDK51DRAFT_40357 [Blyttiomyces helicus]|eukprot:RKO86659.1 hypothetical protein BDK51DRAFT_40357 [Blyttiomyces helicus]
MLHSINQVSAVNKAGSPWLITPFLHSTPANQTPFTRVPGPLSGSPPSAVPENPKSASGPAVVTTPEARGPVALPSLSKIFVAAAAGRLQATSPEAQPARQHRRRPRDNDVQIFSPTRRPNPSPPAFDP